LSLSRSLGPFYILLFLYPSLEDFSCYDTRLEPDSNDTTVVGIRINEPGAAEGSKFTPINEPGAAKEGSKFTPINEPDAAEGSKFTPINELGAAEDGSKFTPINEPNAAEGSKFTPINEPGAAKEGSKFTPINEPGAAEGTKFTPINEPGAAEGSKFPHFWCVTRNEQAETERRASLCCRRRTHKDKGESTRNRMIQGALSRSQ